MRNAALALIFFLGIGQLLYGDFPYTFQPDNNIKLFSPARLEAKHLHVQSLDRFKKRSDSAFNVDKVSHEHFKSFAEQQTPRATVVSCSDSRIQTDAFHKNPVNDLFFIRNIGNQIINTEGSVEYGINHLHTPILMIIGHTHCGAIHAALGDYSKEAVAVKKELNNLHLAERKSTNLAAIENVNNQVAFALKKYRQKIADKLLMVVGVIYDFRDDLKEGHGRLILINLNGEKDPSKMRDSMYLQGIKELSIGYSQISD